MAERAYKLIKNLIPNSKINNYILFNLGAFRTRLLQMKMLCVRKKKKPISNMEKKEKVKLKSKIYKFWRHYLFN